ncbi:RNA-binding domain-containing protein [Aquimarina sp. 2201CG1-2-11]|uniref:RNA-binding domain-containing protein n=1 Tax=Aquimarina discodermiae TaxID=3231043 RepID=UPI0034631B9A
MEENKFIQSLLKDGESDQLELMSQFDIDRVLSTICGFLNTNGGRLILGVNDKNKSRRIENFESNYELLNTVLFSEIIPSSIISIRKEYYKNEEIILIEVIEGNKKPYSYKNKTYIRIATSTRLASEDQMSFLIRDRKIYESSWERSPCLEVEIKDLDVEEINHVIELSNKVRRSSRHDPKDVISFLNSNQLSFNQGFSNGSVVLFGKEPTYFLPQCTIRIVEFPEGKTGSKFGNTVLIEDNLFKAFREVQSYFKRTIPLVSKFSESDWQRVDTYKYPLQALDEGVINAIMHRDYSDSSGEVFIGVYNNRIEITNSGELPHFLTDSKLKKSHQSIPPNPSITHVVFLCGMIEKVGRGTILISEQFKEQGLPAPRWESKNGFTKLTLYGDSKEIVLNERMNNFLQLHTENIFSRQDYEDFFQSEIAEKTARNDLSKLVAGGFLTKTGKGSLTKYERTNKQLPGITGET